MTTVTEPRKEYTYYLKDVERNRAAVAGEREVKRGGIKFLTPLASMCCAITYRADQTQIFTQYATLTDEGTAAYEKYKDLSSFYGATGRTVDGLVGLIFSKKAIKELPPLVQYLDENADSRGSTLRDLAKKACNEAFISPRSGLLVARPTTPQGSSNADVEANNLIPKILHYRFEDIINWNYEVIDNVEKLALLVLRELKTKRTGYKIEVEYQYRVLELIDGVYNQSLYDHAGSIVNAIEPVLVNNVTSREIPFYFIECGSEGKAIINDLFAMIFYH